MAEAGIPTSFIPHDTGAVSAPRGGGGLNDLLLLSAVVLVIASIALAVAVFLYEQFLTKENASKLEQLQRAKSAFQPALIAQFTRLDDRMHAGSRILSAHMAPTAFFAALEQATLQTVSFQSLDMEAGDEQHVTVKLTGLAQSVNSIALQADLFSKNGVISSPIFSNIARQPDGVHFDLSAVVNPAAVGYQALVQNGLGAQVEQGSSSTGAGSTVFGGSQNQTGGLPAASTAAGQ